MIYNGETIFVETVRERCGHQVTWSEIREATEEDLKRYLNRIGPCHGGLEQLVFDEYGPIYDQRYCAICREYLGSV